MSFKLSLLSTGTITFLTPLLLAAISFSFNPPIFNTLPFSDNSPVIAILSFSYSFLANESIEVTKVIPADGPSLGVAPSGKCKWILFSSKNLLFYWLRI
jgi:hypothetical protein